MNGTFLIILGVALIVGIGAWLLLFGEPTAEEPVVPDVVTTEPVVPEAEPGAEKTTEEEGAESVRAEAPAYALDGKITPGEYAHSTEIIGVAVHWWNDADVLRVGLVSPGTGFVAIGFDPRSQMEGANFILGYMEEGEVYVRDDFGTGPTSHMADTDRGGEENILAAGGVEWADQTIIEFVIPLDSGDSMDKPLIPGNSYEILVAYHALNDGFSVRHSGRGSGEIQLDPAP